MDWESNWLEHRSRLTPERIAVVESETGRRWTYRELNERAGRLARHLRERGIGFGDRVAHLAPNDISCLDLFFACSKIGAILVPLNWRLNVNELAYIAQDCAPKLLVYDGEFGGVAENLPVPAKLQAGNDAYERIVQHGPVLQEPGRAQSGDDAMILYTSGTTGKPKGVVLLHRSIFWNAINTVISWNLTADDITPVFMPMFHTGGLNALTFPILHVGGTVVIVRSFEAERVFDILNRERCTIVLMVPTMYQMMTHSPRFAEAAFPTVRVFLSGGAPCPQSVYRAFAAKGFFFKEGYGLTEAGPNNFFLHPEDAPRKRGSVGKPMMFNEVKIVGEAGEELGTGQTGELLLRGNHLFDRYWNNPAATEQALDGGWLRTGDYAMRDEDGCYYIVGRKKDMIITGGENVYPKEVELVIEKLEIVDEVAVIGLPDEIWGEAVTAVVKLQPGASLTYEEMKEHCLKYLARFKVPKRLFVVDEIPKNAVGKTDRKRLAERFG